MQKQQLTVGAVETNCYILTQEHSGAALVIDPGAPDAALIQALEGLQPEWILLTHGHFDHILGIPMLRAHFPEIKIAVHAIDAPCLTDSEKSLLAQFSGSNPEFPPADRLWEDGDRLQFGESEIQLLHTPGHTPGSACYYLPQEGWLFSGDTLFCEDIGRTDFPGGSYETILASLKRLGTLPEETMVFPGHEEESTIGHEKQYNPDMRSVLSP